MATNDENKATPADQQAAAQKGLSFREYMAELWFDVTGWFGFKFRKQRPELNDKPLIYDWSEGKRSESLQQLYQHTFNQAQHSIRWYTKNASNRKWWAIRTRFLSLFFLGLGTILPILIDMELVGFTTDTKASWATLSLAIGTGILAYDRYMAYSTSWMRFIRTELYLKGVMRAFQYDWQTVLISFEGKEPTIEDAKKALLLSLNLRQEFSRAILDETESWIKEFQDNLSFLDDNFKSLMEQAKPSMLEITIENYNDHPGEYEIYVDKMLHAKTNGDVIVVSPITAGLRQITIRSVDTPSKCTSRGVSISADEILKISVNIPNPSQSTT